MMMTSKAAGAETAERFVEASPRTLTGTCELTGVQHCSPRTRGGVPRHMPVAGSAGRFGRFRRKDHMACPVRARRTRCAAV